jgi:propanediol dehydratase large subunit
MGDSDERDPKRPLARVLSLQSPRTGRRRGGADHETSDVDGPEPSLRVRRGRVVELDGVPEADFDATDEFIARHGVVLDVATDAMRLDALTFGRMLVHPSVAADQLQRLAGGMTPGKLAASVGQLRPVELAMAAAKLGSTGGRPENPHELVVVDPGSPWSTAVLASWHAAHGVWVRVAFRAGDAEDPSGACYAAARRAVLLRAAGVRGAAALHAGDHAHAPEGRSQPRAADECDAETLIELLVDLETGLADLAATFGGDSAESGAAELRRRAAAADSLGWVYVARALDRAAELTAYDEPEIRRLCDLLDGGPATLDALRDESAALAARGAQACADLVSEAVEFVERSAASR